MSLLDMFKKPQETHNEHHEEYNIGTQGPPVDKVFMLKRQGLSNNQIIQTLQRDGHSTHDIYDALSLAELKGGVEMSPQTTAQQQGPFMQQPQSMNPAMPPIEQPDGMNSMDNGMQSPQRFGEDKSPELERIEELAEAIIDEKWNEIVKSINKIAEWKERTESKITKLEQQFDDLKTNFDQLHQGVLGKIGDYDKNLMNISTEIQAMDKVFQKVLPIMTENVNELSRITQEMKKR
ncbi:hypothetical protein J4434_03845 [Candidatus Woesearchaeota archaeon]|nr:hypothetical protein [Candidatus Woesearchaeota archaeon]